MYVNMSSYFAYTFSFQKMYTFNSVGWLSLNIMLTWSRKGQTHFKMCFATKNTPSLRRMTLHVICISSSFSISIRLVSGHAHEEQITQALKMQVLCRFHQAYSKIQNNIKPGKSITSRNQNKPYQ